jgi:4-oxalomesaconate tautomerase
MPEAIPYMHYRGGSSKALFFLASDLSSDPETLRQQVLAAMEGRGPGEPAQLDGLGGGTSVTAKAAVISPSSHPEADVDYLFLQVMIGKGNISDRQTCGNILAAVGPFAIESELVPATDPATRIRVHMVNTGGVCELVVETPDGSVNDRGSAKVDGVGGTGAPVYCNYLNIAGATCGALFPTGNLRDHAGGVAITCIDHGMPVILIQAADLGISGYEPPEELEANQDLKDRLEAIRIEMGPKMGLGPVQDASVPKMCLVSAPLRGGRIHTRTFLPHVCHRTIGVLGAVSVATACCIPGTVCGPSALPASEEWVEVEHPTGSLTVTLEGIRPEGDGWITGKSGVIRTARRLSQGVVYLPD